MANNVVSVREVSMVGLRRRHLSQVSSCPCASARPCHTCRQALRSHLRRLPEAAPIFLEEPLIETDTAPGFSALRQGSVGRGPISDMSVDPDSGRLFVVNHTDDSVYALDPTT